MTAHCETIGDVLDMVSLLHNKTEPIKPEPVQPVRSLLSPHLEAAIYATKLNKR